MGESLYIRNSIGDAGITCHGSNFFQVDRLWTLKI